MLTNKYSRNLGRVAALNESDKYCWARLESVASAHDGTKRLDGEDAECIKEDARCSDNCIREAKEIGSCWCGKFTNSEPNEQPSEAAAEGR